MLRQTLSPTEKYLLQSEVRGADQVEVPFRSTQLQEMSVDAPVKPSAEVEGKSVVSDQRSSAIQMLATLKQWSHSIKQGPFKSDARAIGRFINVCEDPFERCARQLIPTIQAKSDHPTEIRSPNLLDSWEFASDERKSSLF